MNPPIFYGVKVYKHPQEFINKVSKKKLSMGLSTSEKAELATYQLRTWRKLGMCNGGIIGH